MELGHSVSYYLGEALKLKVEPVILLRDIGKSLFLAIVPDCSDGHQRVLSTIKVNWLLLALFWLHYYLNLTSKRLVSPGK